ncbi:hypothetical protein [Intestinibacter bartlettii]|uniref:Uncharacterized protein n=1 Tax=Intestinibacter bartlettii TaxID=261299 RepID=A0ABS6DXN7_9FIRM|nr:hypothetical protein [Intestinibacter bartlettii]MBU5336608.1 hypothetical protein [Intestinibacter bartlettii]MDO5010817.1 hypothetical protein [Intestinibacter bartlettii]
MSSNEYNNLLNKYIKLLFEKNKLIIRDAPYIESKYLFHFGDLMVKELEHNKNIKELRIKQNIYENYFGLKREKEIRNIQREIDRQTELLSKKICELEKKCETSKEILSLKQRNKDKSDLVDLLFFDVISVMHPSIYNLKSDVLWERAKKAYQNYDDATLALLKNIKINRMKNFNIVDLKNEIFLLENEIVCMKRRYPYYLESNLSSDEWINSYNKEINGRIKKLEVEEKHIFEKLV